MKKILLPLLLIPMIVGCGDNLAKKETLTEKNFGWKTLESNEIIQVFCGNTNYKYARNDYLAVKYNFISYVNSSEVYVNVTKMDGKESTNYYVGENLTVYHYEI